MKTNFSRRLKPSGKNELLKFLGAHLLVGVGTAALFLAIFIFFDLGNLRSLVHKNNMEIVVYPLLFVFFSITFGSAAMGVGIMGQSEVKTDDDNGPKNGIIPLTEKLSFAKVPANKR